MADSTPVEQAQVSLQSLGATLAPACFVVLWASGFIVARLIAGHADPLTFLVLRYVGSTLAFAVLALVAGARWPRGARAWGQAVVTGVLMQAAYLGAVFWSEARGLPAGITALIAGLQPLLTALLAYPLLREPVSARRWAGIGLGFAGAVLVLLPALGRALDANAGGALDGAAAGRADALAGSLPAVPALVCLGGMVALTLGTLWQKRMAAETDLRTHATVQFAAALIVTAPVAWLTEPGHVDFGWQVVAGLAWAVFGLSVGAISLLLALIRRSAVAGVTSLLYLVPPVAEVMAFALFGERLAPVQLAGMALAGAGVALASRG